MLLLFLVGQNHVCAQNSSTTVKQCGIDQLCVDISFCPELTNESESFDHWLSRYKEMSAILDDRFCGTEPKTGYRKFCCQIPPENKINTLGCGFPTENRILIPIYNLFENPWMALIRDRRNRILCSGTVIAGSFILTTASCSRSDTDGAITVRVGEYDISSSVDCSKRAKDCADQPHDVAVLKHILHPHYNPVTSENDIALLKIVSVKFGESVRPVCLSDEWQSRGSLVGWNSEVVPSKTLVNIVDSEKCVQTIAGYGNGTRKMDNKICLRMELSGNCQDARQNTLPGSSFQAEFRPDRRLVQQGMLLAISSCGESNRAIYAVLTNVTSYMDWIKDNMYYIHPRMRI
ncbi:serine protease grass-like [Armigeres subalbatus]|uniref:serine protease grass-like n=1 Tax=Armigeres subalbatus TaxID=124917 RepID=UPI002ED37825